MANYLAGTWYRVASSGIFRERFAAYLIEGTCDITLNVLRYAPLPHRADFYQHATRFSTSSSNISARSRSLERKNLKIIPN
jgi:hypothetical protein